MTVVHQVAPGVQEEVVDDFSYLVATGPEAFDGADHVLAFRHKPGTCVARVVRGRSMMTIYAKDEYVPAAAIEPCAQIHSDLTHAEGAPAETRMKTGV